MKNFEFYLVIIMTGILLALLVDWYWIMVIPFIYNLLRIDQLKKSFLFGAITGGVFWGFASWLMYNETSGIVANRVAGIMGIGSGFTLVLATALLGILAATIASLTGYSVGRVIKEIRSEKTNLL